VPRGPIETGPMFWANARLSITCFGAKVWGHGQGTGSYYCYFSRVQEKTAAFALALMFDLIGRISLSDATHIHVWADAGPHFRAYQFVSTLGVVVPTKYKRSISINFGQEHHLKGEVDAFFGRVSRYVDTLAHERMIVDTKDLVDACSECFRRRLTGSDEVFLDWFPPDKDDIQLITLRNIPCKLRYCHQYKFSINDHRRKSLFSRGDPTILTGIDLACHIVQDHPAGVLRSCFPQIKSQTKATAPCEKAVDTDDEVEEHVKSSGFDQAVKLIGGWRTSYRKDTPETDTYIKYHRRLQRKRLGMAPAASSVPEASRHYTK
jgi:hypothetical protein